MKGKEKRCRRAAKWVLSFVVSAAMMLGLVPGMSMKTQAYAGNPYQSLVNTTTVVHFNNMDWYLIADASTAVDAGTVTLFAKECIGASVFCNHGTRPEDYTYSGSIMETYLSDYYDQHFVNMGSAIVNGTYGRLYLLSEAEAQALNDDVKLCTRATGADYNEWWTRTFGTRESYNTVKVVKGSDGGSDGEGADYTSCGVRPALQLNLAYVTYNSGTATFAMPFSGYSVSLTGGANATASGGSTTQNGLMGAMQTVTYTANSGYYFDEFAAFTNHGITVRRTSSTTITISGTPNGDATITIPNAERSYHRYLISTLDTESTISGKYVTFGGYEWYVIADNSTAENSGTLTLFAKSFDNYVSVFNSNGSGNAYSTSTARATLASILNSDNGLKRVASAINPLTITTANGHGGNDVTDGTDRLWLLSASEISVLPAAVRVAMNSPVWEYWLRSPGNSAGRAQYVDGVTGWIVGDGAAVNSSFVPRPALQLDLSAVRFNTGTRAFTLNNPGYTVNITGGNNTILVTGSNYQTGVIGEMDRVAFNPADSYAFPEFSPITDHGVTVRRVNEYLVEVTGVPTGDVNIRIPDANGHYVRLDLGRNATVSGNTLQVVLIGNAMDTVTYTALTGYHFEPFDDIAREGITVHRSSASTVTVSGTPTTNTHFFIPDAVADPVPDPTPEPPPDPSPAPTPDPTPDPDDDWIDDGTVNSFVTRLYHVFLDRTPDQEEVDAWVALIVSGEKTAGEVAAGFIFSPEFIDRNMCNSHFLDYLYKGLFNRAADEDGKNGWTFLMDEGYSREMVAQGFLTSPEFFNLCESYEVNPGTGLANVPALGTIQTAHCTIAGCPNDAPVKLMVISLYDTVFGRVPAQDEVDFWVTHMSNHTPGVSARVMVNTFLNGEEYSNLNRDNGDYIRDLYHAIFNRDADEEGFNDWLNRLENLGWTREQVLNGFTASPEFIDQCHHAGIEIGSEI